jgi:hypothetical protein
MLNIKYLFSEYLIYRPLFDRNTRIFYYNTDYLHKYAAQFHIKQPSIIAFYEDDR